MAPAAVIRNLQARITLARHAHDEFDEAIYVLSGRLLVAGDGEPQEAVPGSMFVAPGGTGTASAIHLTSRPGSSDCGPRQGRPWHSCGTSAPR